MFESNLPDTVMNDTQRLAHKTTAKSPTFDRIENHLTLNAMNLGPSDLRIGRGLTGGPGMTLDSLQPDGAVSARIGAVSYLNSKPLIEGFERFAPKARLTLDYPSRLADDLRDGRLDVALIPSVEFFRNPGYEIVSTACVATHGPVLSVRMFSRVHPGNIRTLALDEGSRTSATLLRIMLAEKYGVQPKLRDLPIGATIPQCDADAVLLIGDRAINTPPGQFKEVWDLGEHWLEWTGLPFVFAMWVARPSIATDQIEQALNKSRDLGVASLETIAKREAAGIGVDAARALDYLRNNLHFTLGHAERFGLQLFHELAAAQNLVPADAKLVFRTTHHAESRMS